MRRTLRIMLWLLGVSLVVLGVWAIVGSQSHEGVWTIHKALNLHYVGGCMAAFVGFLICCAALKETTDMSRSTIGSVLARLGVAMVLFALGLLALAAFIWFGTMMKDSPGEHDNVLHIIFPMAIAVGSVGIPVWIIGVVLRPSEHDDLRRPEEHLCRNCGCQPKEGSKTCEWCGADLK